MSFFLSGTGINNTVTGTKLEYTLIRLTLSICTDIAWIWYLEDLPIVKWDIKQLELDYPSFWLCTIEISAKLGPR